MKGVRKEKILGKDTSRKGEKKRQMDELGQSTTKIKCHISPRCFVYSRPNIRLWETFERYSPFHCSDSC